MAELVESLGRLHEDAQVRVVVLTGAGRAFSAGADFGGPRREGGRTLDEWWDRLEDTRRGCSCSATFLSR